VTRLKSVTTLSVSREVFNYDIQTFFLKLAKIERGNFMCKKLLSLIVISLLLNLVCYSTVTANSELEKKAKFAAKVKLAIAKLGTGPDARIEVKLRDKTKLKGYISESNDEGFVVVDEKTGSATKVLYPQVKKVKGKNNLTGEQIALGVAIAIITIIFVLYYLNKD